MAQGIREIRNRPHSQAGSAASEAVPPSARRTRSHVCWRTIGKITIVGALGLICLLSWVRLSQLRAESRRLDRLIGAEKTRMGELARQREVVCDLTELEKNAPDLGLVPPPMKQRMVKVGCLSVPRDDTRDEESTPDRVAASADPSDTTQKRASASPEASKRAAMADYDIFQ
ncbi:MAG: hypothetical protein R6V19_14265 [Armatimonadota bacterium]